MRDLSLFICNGDTRPKVDVYTRQMTQGMLRCVGAYSPSFAVGLDCQFLLRYLFFHFWISSSAVQSCGTILQRKHCSLDAPQACQIVHVALLRRFYSYIVWSRGLFWRTYPESNNGSALESNIAAVVHKTLPSGS